MTTWQIILLVCGIITLCTTIIGILIAFDYWRREKNFEWKAIVAGVFAIPIAIVMLIAWPIVKLKEYLVYKLYTKFIKDHHIIHFTLLLEGLPFKPSGREIIYIENMYDEQMNEIIRRNYSFIQRHLNKKKQYPYHFAYLPFLCEEMCNEDKAISYRLPNMRYAQSGGSIERLSSSFLLDYMHTPENRKNIHQCFAKYYGSDEDGCSYFYCIEYDVSTIKNERRFLKRLFSLLDVSLYPPGKRYQHKKEGEPFNADNEFKEVVRLLIGDIEEKVSELRKMGISQWVLDELVRPKQQLSRLVVTKDLRIILPDYNDMEIKMEPLVKAVYLLFLKHPEGIFFKHLPDYREELTDIYKRLRPYGLDDRSLQSVEDVTNPLLNSINEKCARIRGAFISKFDDYLAESYYVDGDRGEAKKITLPRDLVVWE